MRGSHRVVVRNGRVQFKFDVRRNITILRGNSATGKTTLIGMIADYERNGRDSGIELSCDKPCVVLSGRHWRRELSFVSDSIVFVDEGNAFTSSYDFAAAMRDSDNYYVIATRESLFALPYSVDEVYGIRNTGRTTSRYPQVKRLYSSFYHLYGAQRDEPFVPDLVVVEDSNSGFQFFSAVCEKCDLPCVSAGGKSNVCRVVRESQAQNVLVIADGAAFGPEMEQASLLGVTKNVRLFLPESFEWLVLKSGLVSDQDVASVLANPSEFIESSEYFSWERFFAALLVEQTKGTYLQYGKSLLNEAYLGERETDAILSGVPDVGLRP